MRDKTADRSSLNIHFKFPPVLTDGHIPIAEFTLLVDAGSRTRILR